MKFTKIIRLNQIIYFSGILAFSTGVFENFLYARSRSAYDGCVSNQKNRFKITGRSKTHPIIRRFNQNIGELNARIITPYDSADWDFATTDIGNATIENICHFQFCLKFCSVIQLSNLY